MVHSNHTNVFCFLSSSPSSPPVTTAVFGLAPIWHLFLFSTNTVIAGAGLPIHMIGEQGVTKRRRLSLLTNSALVIRVQMRGEGGIFEVSANEYSCAHHVTWSPNKLWRSTYIFNLCWRGFVRAKKKTSVGLFNSLWFTGFLGGKKLVCNEISHWVTYGRVTRPWNEIKCYCTSGMK